MRTIQIQGARTHNLKNVHLDIPRDQFVVITGLSGSGKSSLAFDTLYAEGQRRYVESLSAYARQFLSMMEKPDVDAIDGLSPAISIEQKSTSHNPRSTVGTITEIYDYLRLLYARVGEPFCPKHMNPLKAQTITQMVDTVLSYPEGTKVMLMAPIVRERKGEHVQLFKKLIAQGFIRARIDGEIYDLDEPPKLELHKKHTIEVIVDRIKVRDDVQTRLADSFETAVQLAEGLASIAFIDDNDGDTKGDGENKSAPKTDILFSSKFSCPECDYAIPSLEPRLFSFNNPVGACSKCDGLGVQQFFNPDRIVQDPEATLAEGAVRGWDRRNSYYFQLLESLAAHYEFDINKPYNKLPKKIRELLLYGSGKEKILFQFVSSTGKRLKRRRVFEGVINNMDRRYRETDSNTVREELAKYLSQKVCEDCSGDRLCKAARHVYVADRTLPEIAKLPIGEAEEFFANMHLEGYRGEIAERIKKEINDRLHFLVQVGLTYLSLSRSADTLSGGEAQRIRLASQIGSGLVGVMYILDEPSIGLHQRDNEKLLQTLFHLRDLGNTVIVVEHDEEAIRMADHVIDIGPQAGVHGGEVIAQGKVADLIAEPRSITGKYLSGDAVIYLPQKRTPNDKERQLKVIGASGNNLQDVNISIPLGLMTCVTGVSGSGKSTLINQTLYPVAAHVLNRAHERDASPYEEIEGLELLDKVVDIDQSAIGRTPRSNAATYTGIFTPIRDLFAATQEARSRGYKTGRFSFNVKGGRCEACQGDGMIKVEMHFLADVYVNCDECHGKRYNRETLEIFYKGKNIHEILNMTVEEARVFFDPVPVIARKLQTLIDVGLSYIRIGQSATTLSGGEAQRIKLSRELSKRDTGNTLYILDEPTTGLHFHDIKQLLAVLHRLRDQGNTIVVIEHNLDVIKTADWIIDIGPEGGDKGGKILVSGTPEKVAKCKASHTGRFLGPLLKR